MLQGKVHRFGSDVDTDVIIPARYLNSTDPKELASHCMEDIDADFTAKVAEGDFIVADDNFGCGSSREHAPIAIKAAGISCVIANSFARIFYRNALNIGLPIMECPEAVKDIGEGHRLEVDLAAGRITDLDTGKTYTARPFPDFAIELIADGGLVEYTRKLIRERQK